MKFERCLFDFHGHWGCTYPSPARVIIISPARRQWDGSLPRVTMTAPPSTGRIPTHGPGPVSIQSYSSISKITTETTWVLASDVTVTWMVPSAPENVSSARGPTMNSSARVQPACGIWSL